MILEKMSELLLLSHVLRDYYCDIRNRKIIRLNGKEYDYDKIYERYKVLMEEFLSPYVIDNDSRE